MKANLKMFRVDLTHISDSEWTPIIKWLDEEIGADNWDWIQQWWVHGIEFKNETDSVMFILKWV